MCLFYFENNASICSLSLYSAQEIRAVVGGSGPSAKRITLLPLLPLLLSGLAQEKSETSRVLCVAWREGEKTPPLPGLPKLLTCISWSLRGPANI